MAITEYNYIPTYIKRTINNKPKDVIKASYWNELFNLLINQGDHTAKELGNVLNHFTAAINEVKGIADGKYVKPTDGIPKTDLAQDVQNSLSKADTALQEHQSLAAYRTAEAQDLIDNAKQDKLIAGKNINIAEDGKTISAINCSDKILTITITGYTDAEIVADKTYAEIKAAIDSGYPIHTIDNHGDTYVPRVNFESAVERITLAWTERLDSNTWAETVYEVNTQDSWGVTLREYVTPSEIGNLIALKTQAKDNLVVAINEVKQTTDTKQDKLIAGENITIAADGKTISATGGGGTVPKPLTYDYMPEGYPTKVMETVTLMEEQDVAFEAMNDTIRSASLTNAFEIAEGQICIVNWDGTEYECVAFVFAGEGIALGNLSIIGMGDDTGEPFLCGYNSDGVYNKFFTLDTSASHTISIKRVDEVITPMAYKYVPEGYPSKSGQIATLMEEQGLAFGSWHGDIYKANSPNPLAIAEGKTYAVNWDGTEYKCVCAVSYSDPVIGNLSIIGEGKDTGEPFIYVCYTDETNTSFYTLDPSATHTISVKEVETITPMSEEFIPHMNVSAFTNDAGYLTLATLPKYEGVVV